MDQVAHTPPGLVYLYNTLPSLLTPPAVVYIVRVLSKANTPYRLPELVWILLGFLSLAAKVVWDDYVVSQDAASAGAVLPPSMDVGFGGVQMLVKAARGQKKTYMLDARRKRSEVVGYTFSLRILFQNRIFTSDPEYIKIILATEFDKYEKGEEVRGVLQSLLGTGVFNSDGKMWKFHRAMTRPFFSKERIGHFDIFDAHAEDAIDQLTARLREGIAVDFQDLVARFTLDSATEFLFGRDARSLSAGLSYPHTHPLARLTAGTAAHPANAFAAALAAAQKVTARRTLLGGHWPLREFRTDAAAPHVGAVFKFVGPLVEAALARAKAAGVKPVRLTEASADREVGAEETLLDHLVHYTRDPKLLMDEVLNILIAGRDTTAATLTFVVYMLAEHPEVLRRVREEILSKVGNGRRPTYDDLREMKYLRAVINETLRLYPPVPANMRTSKEATTWPSTKPDGKPFFIPAHTRITYSVWILHRRKDLWGPDAEEFDPDRFLDERLHKYLTPNPFIFLPFNAGPRICLGQQFAYNEVSFFLVRLLQRVSGIALAPEAQPPASRPPAEWATEGEFVRRQKVWAESHLTMYAKDGLWVTMEEDAAHDDGVADS